MSAPKAVVTGTGRCGTSYMAHVLSTAGLNAGHEDWFLPPEVAPKIRLNHLDVDVSWLAVPAVESGEWSGPVVHIVRHPVATVRALVGSNFLTSPGSPWTRFALQQEPDMVGMRPVGRALHWWERWNTRAFNVADVVVRIEDLGRDSEREAVSAVLGHEIASEAVESISTNVHHGRRAQVAEQTVWDALGGIAERFGYTR